MTETGGANIRWALQLLGTLARLGVRDVVISPGSRSTPLVLAATHLPELRTHVVLDERSAGFMALGIGKASGIPAVLICTSGTAAANYYPAVIEARQSFTPLLICSADRPEDQQRVSAPQTINQYRLFGSYPHFFFNFAGMPQVDKQQGFTSTRQIAQRAFNHAVTDAGPVHLNCPFSKPLEPPISEFSEIINDFRKRFPKSELNQKTESKPELTKQLEELSGRLAGSSRPLVIAGPVRDQSPDAELLNAFFDSDTIDIPVLAEAVSGVRHLSSGNLIRNYECFLRGDGLPDHFKPDFILRIGLPPVSKGVNIFLKNCRDIEQWCISESEDPPEPHHLAKRIIRLPHQIAPNSFSGLDAGKNTHRKSDWLDLWQNADQAAGEAINETLKSHSDTLTDGLAIRMLTDARGDNNKSASLFISNSLPVRDIDLFGSTPLPFRRVFHNRGASGIDGITSTALGCAVSSEDPVWLLAGDLTFLHDINALTAASGIGAEKINLTIFVINNGGGTIFRMLPVSDYSGIYTPFFETPQTADAGKLCSAFGIPHESVRSPRELQKYLAETRTGVNVIECHTDAGLSMEQRRKLWNLQSGLLK